jgi:glycerate kinase
LTGEGRLDNTSLLGKFTIEVAKFAKRENLFIIGIFGQVSSQILKKKFDKTFTLTKKKVTLLNKRYKLNNTQKAKIKKIGNLVFELIKKDGI